MIGAIDLASKEQLLLRSLVRLLDGGSGLRLQFGEALTDCNVVFVPGDQVLRLPGRCVGVHVLAVGAEASPLTRPGLAVSMPLRATNVMAVLNAAAALLADALPSNPENGLAALFHLLVQHLVSRERRTTALLLQDGRQLIIDFSEGRLHTEATLDDLLAGRYRIGESRRATAQERDSLHATPALRLRDLLWAAAHRLGDTHVPATELRGSYQLRRWPDAAALSRPGFPRLAALLTSRAMTVAQACDASGASHAAVRWFLEAALVLGIALPVESAPPARSVAPTPAEPARSLLGRLRERLKLW